MQNPRTTPDPVMYTTPARAHRATFESTAARARRNETRRAFLAAYHAAHPNALPAEVLAALDRWEAENA